MSGSPSETLKFRCKKCGVVLSCPASRAGQAVRCKACQTELVVPQPTSASQPPADDFDGYAIRDEDLPSRPKATLPPWLIEDEPAEQPKRPQRPASERPAGERAASKAAPKRKPKADDGHRADADAPLDGWGDWGPPTPRDARPGERVRGDVPVKKKIIDDEPPEEPPYGQEQLDLITGVWTIPWQDGEAVLRWFLFSIGVFCSSWLALALIALFSDGGMFGAIGGGFLAMVLLWIGLWTFSYGASCFLGILVDTANGSRRVNTWPDADWREWVFTMFQVGFPLALSGAAGWGLGQAVEPLGVSSNAVAVWTTLLVFPVLLLSSVTEGSVMMPYSAPVWTSLVRMPVAWLLTYAAAALLVLPQLGLGTIRDKIGGYPFLIASSLWIAAASFIYGRLLGRLLCRIRFVLGVDDEDEDEEADGEA